MLDMGFADDMAHILGLCTAEQRQTCLFSATLPAWVRDVAPQYMRTAPTVVDLVGDASVKASTDVRHLAIPAPGPVRDRVATINDAVQMYASAKARVLIFCDTKAECDALSTSDELRFECKCLHGDIPQAAREKTLAAYKNGRFRVLIATDVAARGLDMNVELVIQSKPPLKRMSGREDVETYVHRSGRTGRAGRKGVCATLFGPRDRQALANIESHTKNAFEWTGAPNPRTLLRTAAQTAASDAAAIEPGVTTFFEEAAAELLAAKGGDATQALAAALALATGTLKPPSHRSLLTMSDGYCTMHAKMRSRVPNAGFVWGALRRVLPEGACEGTDNVRSMRLTADGFGAVFDLNEDLLDHPGLAEQLASEDERAWLRIVNGDLPELLDSAFGPGGGKGGKGDGGKGGKGGGGGKGGYGGKGGGYGGGKGGGYGGGKGDGGKGGGGGGGWAKGGGGRGKGGGGKGGGGGTGAAKGGGGRGTNVWF